MDTSWRPVDFSRPEEQPTYVVRLWVPPSTPLGAWAVDDWTVTGARDVVEVIEWAEGRAAGGRFELFVQDAGAGVLVLLLGSRPDVGRTVTIPLTRA